MRNSFFKVLALILPLVSCPLKAQEVRIGAVLPLTGAAAGVGHAIKAGLVLGVEDINAAGGAAGKPLRLIIEDTLSETKNAVAGFHKLVEAEKVKVLFTVTSSAAMALKPLAEAKGILLFANGAHPEITKNTRYVMRHGNTADHDARLMAKALLRTGPRRVGIVYQQDDWGILYEEVLRKSLEARGVQVKSESHYLNEPDLKPALFKLRASSLEALVNVSFGASVAVFVKQVRELNIQSPVYLSLGYVLTPQVQGMVGDLTKGFFFQTYLKQPQFEERYRQSLPGDPPMLGQVAYTDLELLCAAIKHTGSVDPALLAGYIRKVGSFSGRFETVRVSPEGDIPVETVIERIS